MLLTKGRNMKICQDCGRLVDMNDHDCPVKKERRNKRQREYMKNEESTNMELTTQEWRRFRKDIILKDNGECQRCLIKFHRHTYDDLTIHHIKPRLYFPELMYDESNCVTLCRECNLAMGLNGIDFDWNSGMRTLKITPHF